MKQSHIFWMHLSLGMVLFMPLYKAVGDEADQRAPSAG